MNGAEIRTVRLSEIRGKENSLLASASKARREKALRFRYLDDRLRCLAAGDMMRRYLPGFSEELLALGADGKPFLRNGVAFSISHGGNYIVLAWCEGIAGIGVDVEPIMDFAYYRDILPYAATLQERVAIGDDASKAVRLWTRKESLYKSRGEGISDFRELPDVLEDNVFFGGMLCRLQSWEEDGHMFSIALRGI